MENIVRSFFLSFGKYFFIKFLCYGNGNVNFVNYVYGVFRVIEGIFWIFWCNCEVCRVKIIFYNLCICENFC